jgi:hypothetical protein
MRKSSTHTPARTVDEYLAAVPSEFREALVRLRAVIRSAALQAEEVSVTRYLELHEMKKESTRTKSLGWLIYSLLLWPGFRFYQQRMSIFGE